MRRSAWVLLAALAVTAGCARVLAPNGWAQEDRTPPQLVSTRPAQLQVVPDFDGDVVFKFDERVSDQGINDQLAVVSPDTGLPRVTKHGSEIHVRPRLGWRKGVVYQVALLPGFKDMFGNASKEPAQIVFSTGPAITPTVIAGMLLDRLTGQAASGALVQAVHEAPDSLTYTTASDSSGFFALRYLPEGEYMVRAFLDKNHDRHPQLREPQVQQREQLRPRADSAILSTPLSLLAGDTTAARLSKVEYVDSLKVLATFDDYLDPARGLGGVSVTLVHLPDSVAVPITGLYFPAQLDSIKQAADTSAAARRARAQPDTVAARKRALPTQSLVIIPGRPLPMHSRFRLTVAGVTNINRLPNGGGSQTFTTPEPPKAPEAAKPAAGGNQPEPARTPAGADTTRARPGPPAARDTTRR